MLENKREGLLVMNKVRRKILGKRPQLHTWLCRISIELSSLTCRENIDKGSLLLLKLGGGKKKSGSQIKISIPDLPSQLCN